ncbi:Serine/Threonine kinase domain protein (macronuclear) [Tetrahymena thermophila SB210]|uniref:non-specific serine/threonine protein kinase n=1 Tax=Tetrahymena thermophila (strain SB210) TaxID=312017 RepID=I7M6B9_TETTS|nr:Serine/Threonine kinase domain protein [Tetrahymena thermophila SB210]EAR84926.2 Serine/Threonine kinase domain protein [Tetrahymena thermophila SB210]|eukprot:XP_001032589.2 Serine/Threonine kinase domain protein [Tetrahymena thermophila SB210]
MGANQSCTMCVNPQEHRGDLNQSRRKVKGGIFMSSSSSSSSNGSSLSSSYFSQNQIKTQEQQPEGKLYQLQSKIEFKDSKIRQQVTEAKPSEKTSESISYDFSNFDYCREQQIIKSILEAYNDDLKQNQFEFTQAPNENTNISQLSGGSLLNQLNELDTPKEIKPRNFKIAFQANQSRNNSLQRRSTSTTYKNQRKASQNLRQNSQKNVKQSVLQNEKITFSQFEIVKTLCENKLSKVYLCQKDKVPLAMKVIKKSDLKYTNQLENIWRERKILEKLDSSYTVKLEYAFTDQENIYLVTDYKPHGTLKQFIISRKVLQLQEIKRILAQIIACLQYLHEEQSILYRGLQLDNILLDELMNVCLCDFGNSKFIKSKRQINTSFVFDLREENQSPEQIRQKHQEASSDYWQLGIIAYQMIYRKHPFKAQNRKQTLNNIHNSSASSVSYPPFSYNSEPVPSEFIDFIQYCLKQDKSLRPKSFYDIQQTPLFQGFDWQELLETYTSKYTQAHDTLNPCCNIKVVNNKLLELSCDQNPFFLNSINDSLCLLENNEDVATTIVLNTKNNLNNNTSSSISKQKSSCLKSNADQSSQIENNEIPPFEKDEILKPQQQKQKKRSTFIARTNNNSRQISNSRLSQIQQLKQNSSIDGDDENNPNEPESYPDPKIEILKNNKKQKHANFEKCQIIVNEQH